MGNDDCIPDIPPFTCAMEMLSNFEQANKTPILDLFQISYVRLALMLCPGVETVLPKPDVIYYQVEDVAALEISVAATGNRHAYDMLSEVCRANIYTGQAIPKAMRPICSQLISGEFKPPSRRGPRPRADFGLFFVSYYLANYICDAYGIPKTRGDGFEESSAADIVNLALNKHGVDANYTKIRDYLTHSKHKSSREKCDWIQQMLYEPHLAELGLISRQRRFGISPFGLFMPLGRMT